MERSLEVIIHENSNGFSVFERLACYNGNCWIQHRRPKLIVCILYGTSGASYL